LQPKVSIILPVYKVEQYLTECLNSLVNQTLSDIEIIAINDGSPDNSIHILNEYQAQYPEIIRVYSTENRGVSHARNYGLSLAHGEYVMFVDSDDYVEPIMCETLYKKAVADNNDMVLCSRYDISTNQGELKRKLVSTLPLCQNFNLNECCFEILNITPFPWDKLFKRSVLQNHLFEEGLRFEDLLWVHTLTPTLKSIGSVDIPLYNYRKSNTGGFLNSFTEATLDIVTVFERLIETYKTMGIYSLFHDEIEFLCIRHFFYRYKNFYTQNKHTGELALKLELIYRSIDFLELYFPNWRANHYLKYCPINELRYDYNRYFTKKRIASYVTIKHYLPSILFVFYDAVAFVFHAIKCVNRDNIKSILIRRLKERT